MSLTEGRRRVVIEGVEPDQALEVHDLLGDRRYLWEGQRNYVDVGPLVPARLFLAYRWMQTERDFDHFA